LLAVSSNLLTPAERSTNLPGGSLRLDGPFAVEQATILGAESLDTVRGTVIEAIGNAAAGRILA
jgi:hypothetical protein